MKRDVKLKMLAFDYSHNNLALAKEYTNFLNEAKDSDELDMRLYCLDKRAGEPVESVMELLSFLIE